MGVNISRAKGQLKITQPTEDAVVCFIFSGAAVAGKIALSEPKQIFGIADLTTLGITEGNNVVAYRDIMDFYAKAGEGAELNFMLVSDATQLANICDKANNIAKKVIEFTEGRGVIFLVNVKKPGGYVATVTNGLDVDVWNAVTKLQELAVSFLDQNIPFVGCLPGLSFLKANIADLPARSTLTNDFVSISLYCEKADSVISMGVLAAWIAKHQVHENIGRVASGRVTETAFYPDGTAVKDMVNYVTTLNQKGLIFPIKVGSKAGYYFNDDHALTAIISDYSSISWNRTINKAHRLADGILIEKLKDDVDVDQNTGKIESTVASDWESDVENAIRSQMMRASAKKKKEISGVKVTVDPDSDIINSEVDVAINIVRKGQAKEINVTIGYTPTI